MKKDIIESIVSPISVRREVHRISKEMFDKYLPPDAVVYDIGCGQKPFANYLRGKVRSHIGVDLADGFYKPEQVDIIGTAYQVPAEDGVADAVISSQVIEHLETPLVAVDETYRILREGGVFFVSFPFLYPLHAEPRDFMRYTEFYLRQELAADKFDVVDIQRVSGFWYMIGMFLGMYLSQLDRGILRKLFVVRVLSWVVCMLCDLLHHLEKAVVVAVGKDHQKFSSKWTMNYVCVLKKKRV